MSFEFFSINGELMPTSQAVISLENIEYAYGYGVYETLRVIGGKVLFISDHIERLLNSANIISLEHEFSQDYVENALTKLIQANKQESYNIKIMLIGGRTKIDANLYMLCFNPKYPDKKLFRDGAKLNTTNFERVFPQAKTLNMLQSYLAYKKALEMGAYDSLLVNNKGFVTEGTRTNFFCIKDHTLYSPFESEILLGVTRKYVLKVALENGWKYEEINISLDDILEFDGAFITSTSSKIMPIREIDSINLNPLPKSLKELMDKFAQFLIAL